ncbi:MAG: Stp1/IreP family PP2C-type Ser/Thr phosphatase [Myxococcota bacterium]|nr:Stp1/IreP family PP2C-type Ser/Thr phosphatase [Myxococcota bacterium]
MIEPRGDATVSDQPHPDASAVDGRSDETEPSPTSTPTPASDDGDQSEPTIRLGGAPVEHLTPESARPAVDGIVIEYFGRTDVGLVREHNEDNFLVADLSQERRGLGDEPAILRTTLGDRGVVFAVCDGMGGAAAGEVASQMAVDTVHEIMQAGRPPRDRDQLARRLVRAIEEAGARIFSAAKMDRTRRGMGTTATVAAMIDSTIFVGNVGDSRAYILRGDQFALISKDQSLVNQLIEAGQLTEEEAEAFEHSNIILQALGTTEDVTVDLTFLELRRGDRLLMCSDGLSGLVHGEMMKEVLRSSRDLSEAAQQLIAMANAGGGHDNITIILAEFDGAALRETSAEARVAYQQYPLPPEDPSLAEPLPPRPTAMKSGGPKPGADVKGEGAQARQGYASSGGSASSSKRWVIGVVLLVLLITGAMLVVMMDDGERADAADPGDTTRVTIASTVSSERRAASSERRAGSLGPGAPAEQADGRIHVSTDVPEGVLFVNGERHAGSIAGGVTLELPAGAYRLEVREGDVRVADRVVTLEAGQDANVDLSMPAGTMPEMNAVAGPGAVAPGVGSDPGANAAAGALTATDTATPNTTATPSTTAAPSATAAPNTTATPNTATSPAAASPTAGERRVRPAQRAPAQQQGSSGTASPGQVL